MRQHLSPSERALVLLMHDLVNEVRAEGGMVPLTEQDLEQRLRRIVREEMRKARP
jgi:hypothetical protein